MLLDAAGVYVACSAAVKPDRRAQPFLTALLCQARSSRLQPGFKRNRRFEVWSCLARRLYGLAANPRHCDQGATEGRKKCVGLSALRPQVPSG